MTEYSKSNAHWKYSVLHEAAVFRSRKVCSGNALVSSTSNHQDLKDDLFFQACRQITQGETSRQGQKHGASSEDTTNQGLGHGSIQNTHPPEHRT